VGIQRVSESKIMEDLEAGTIGTVTRSTSSHGHHVASNSQELEGMKSSTLRDDEQSTRCVLCIGQCLMALLIMGAIIAVLLLHDLDTQNTDEFDGNAVVTTLQPIMESTDGLWDDETTGFPITTDWTSDEFEDGESVFSQYMDIFFLSLVAMVLGLILCKICGGRKSLDKCYAAGSFQNTFIVVFSGICGIAIAVGVIVLISVTATTDYSEDDPFECGTSDPLPWMLSLGGWCMLSAGLFGTAIISKKNIDEKKKDDQKAEKKQRDTQQSENEEEKGCVSKLSHYAGELKIIVTENLQNFTIFAAPAMHFTDTMSDVASTSEFYIISEKPQADCNGVNMFKMFCISCFCMLLYRILAAFKLWQLLRKGDDGLVELDDVQIKRLRTSSAIRERSSCNVMAAAIEMEASIDIVNETKFNKKENGKCKNAVCKVTHFAVDGWQGIVRYFTRPGYKGARNRVFWQLLDLELFHLLYMSITVGFGGSTATMRLLKVYEAVFEAAPQATLQTIYLMFTHSDSFIIISSALFSYVMLTLSVTSYDGGFLGWNFKDNTGNFLRLFLFRVLDVPTKILSYALLWYLVGGEYAFALVFINGLIGAFVCGFVHRDWHLQIKCKKTEKDGMLKKDDAPPPIDDALMMVVATPITLGHKHRVQVLKAIWAYLGIEGFCVIVMLWAPFSSNLWHDRSIPEWIFYVAVYVTVGHILKWLYIIRGEFCDGFVYEAKNGESSRVNHMVKDVTNLRGLLKEGNYNEAMEVIAFKNGSLEHADNLYYSYKMDDKMNEFKELSVFSIALRTGNDKIYQKIWDMMDDDKRVEALLDTNASKELIQHIYNIKNDDIRKSDLLKLTEFVKDVWMTEVKANKDPKIVYQSERRLKWVDFWMGRGFGNKFVDDVLELVDDEIDENDQQQNMRVNIMEMMDIDKILELAREEEIRAEQGTDGIIPSRHLKGTSSANIELQYLMKAGGKGVDVMKKAGGAMMRVGEGVFDRIRIKSNKAEDSRSETDPHEHSKTMSSNQSTEFFAGINKGLHGFKSTVADTVVGGYEKAMDGMGVVKDMIPRRKTVTDGDGVVADREMGQKTLSTRFVERMWSGKNINSFLNSGDGKKWSMFWMANALNNKTLCETAWESMSADIKIKNIFDVLKEAETKTRVIGENGPLFARFAHRLQSEETTANKIKEDQRNLLSMFLREYPVIYSTEATDEKENDNGDEIQSVPSMSITDAMIIEHEQRITKESDDRNRMNSNENESDSVRNDVAEKQSVPFTLKQERTEIVDDAMNGDDQKQLNRNELEYAE